MQKIIGHHTCKNNGNGKYLEKQGLPAALSEYNKEATKNPFLGTGYYFWDFNIEMAKYWGKTHYDNSYYIFEADIPYNETMLDLVGNRQHMKLLIDLMDELKEENEESIYWEIGKFIEFLKQLAKTESYTNIFPFKSVRAIDHSSKKFSQDYSFDESSRSFIDMNPRIIVCVMEANKETIQSFKLIKTNE